MKRTNETKELNTLMGNRLYVGNLSFNTDTDAARDASSRFGGGGKRSRW